MADAYYAAQGQRLAERRRRERPLTRKMEDPEINRAVREGLAQNWAPEQIAGRMKQQQPDTSQHRVSPQTIYAWIQQDERSSRTSDPAGPAPHALSNRCCGERGKRPCRRKNSATTGDAARSKNRPEVIKQRLRLGDFEGDTVLGPPGTGGLATLVDRKRAADHCRQGSIEKRRPRA